MGLPVTYQIFEGKHCLKSAGWKRTSQARSNNKEQTGKACQQKNVSGGAEEHFAEVKLSIP